MLSNDVAPIVLPSPEMLQHAINLLRSGEVIALPTETVYGLGADAENGKAVARIYSIKSRPRFNPLIVHIGSIELAHRYAEWNDRAEQLARAFWPGPLTLILPAKQGSPASELVTAAGDTVALRLPAHPVMRELLVLFGQGVAAPSANRSGQISPTSAQDVLEDLGNCLPLILDGGRCMVGIESTVVDVSGEETVLLRPGMVTKELIKERTGLSCRKPSDGEGLHKSPGQLAKHYSPSKSVRLNIGSVHAGEGLLAFGPALETAGPVYNLSEEGDLLQAASNLFAGLRALDAADCESIAVMPVPEEGVGVAINDRLRRAATPDTPE